MLTFNAKPTKFSIPLEGIILGLVGVLYAPLLWYWVDGWLNKTISIQHEYFSHGLLGIPFAAYLVWEARSHWQKLPNQTHWLSIPLMLLAIVFYATGLLDVMNLSLPILLAGLLLALKGKKGFALHAFPWVLVLFATPTQLPYLIEPYILPLQSFIAAVAGFILQQFDVNVYVDGIYLFVNDQLVEVAPHCAGLKMLFTSLYMGLILTYWTGLNRSKLRTGLFFVGIVGVSVVGNIIRNATLTYFHGAQMTKAFEWLHDSWGGDVYSAGMLGMLIVLIRLLERYVPNTLAVNDAVAEASPSKASLGMSQSNTTPPPQSSQKFSKKKTDKKSNRPKRKPPGPDYF
ncbi:MAG: cyanoexosortase B [Cyanobacteria bacterium J06573_11]